MTIKDLIKHAQTYPSDMPCAYSLWLPEDVETTIESLGVSGLTEEQIANVLSNVQRRFDANYGISWDTIEFWIGEEVRGR